MNKGFLPILCIFIGILTSFQAKSQDIHFSQVGNSPLNISPALTAVFSGDVRAIGNYKSQWRSVPVSYMNFSGSFEKKFTNKKFPHSLFGGGIIFDHDKAGDGDLSMTRIGLNASYTHQMAKQLFLTAGFQFSAAQRMFKPQQLSFDSQYNGDLYDAGISSGEVFDNSNFLFLNYSGGLNIHFQKPAKRTKIDFGGSVFNLNEANQSFYKNNDIRLIRRFHLHALGSFMIGDKLDLAFLGLMSLQDPYVETMLGLGFKYYLNNTMSKELSLQIGANIRLGDAIIPTFELEFRNTFKVAVSYDVNVSDFVEATNAKGSPEFSFIYMLKRVKPFEKTKICPLY